MVVLRPHLFLIRLAVRKSPVKSSEILCRCLNVSRAEVQQAIDVFSADSVQSVTELTEAGTGCMCCRTCIVDMIRQKQMAARQLEVA